MHAQFMWVDNDGLVVSIAFAVVAAFLFAMSAALQQSSARTAALARPGRNRVIAAFGLLGTLVRDRIWLAGFAAALAGFAAHVVALHLGSIPTVQAVLVVQLLFALPFAAVRRRSWPLVRDWFGTALVCSGLVMLVSQGVPRGEVRPQLLPIGAAIAVTAIVLLVVVARLLGHHQQTRSALVAVAAGCCFTTTAVAVYLTAAQLPHLSWALPCLGVSIVVGGLLVQEAFASGSLPTALTAMTITDPVLSYTAGVTLFAVASTASPAVLVAAAALVFIGVVLLANSPTIHDESGRRTA
jgi:drug/metabolite transporter (DMT)-like permease